MAVRVLTLREAARRLDRPRPHISIMLASGKLTPASINDRPAVADDLTFRRLARQAQKQAVAA
jgi:hypothetical protein